MNINRDGPWTVIKEVNTCIPQTQDPHLIIRILNQWVKLLPRGNICLVPRPEILLVHVISKRLDLHRLKVWQLWTLGIFWNKGIIWWKGKTGFNLPSRRNPTKIRLALWKLSTQFLSITLVKICLSASLVIWIP